MILAIVVLVILGLGVRASTNRTVHVQREGLFSSAPYQVGLLTSVSPERTAEIFAQCLRDRGMEIWAQREIVIGGVPSTFIRYGTTVRADTTVWKGKICLFVGCAGKPAKTPKSKRLLADLEREWYSALAADPDAPKLDAYYRPAAQG